MKQTVILHGTDGDPTELEWQGWLKRQFEASSYKVWFPQLPDCHTPNLTTYDAFLRQSGWDFTDNVLIGHSSGATAVLHLLQQDWFPRQKAVILVGTFLNERLLQTAKPSWYEPGQFDKLFVDDFDLRLIKQKADRFYFVHGDDDPYCDYDEAKALCSQLGDRFITLSGAGHIAASAGVAELPELVNVLENDGVLEKTV